MKSRKNINNLPSSVDSSLSFYEENSHWPETDSGLKERAYRVGKIQELFASEILSDKAKEAGMLREVAERVHWQGLKERQALGSMAIAEYFTNPENDLTSHEAAYMMALWSDIPVIEEAAGSYRKNLSDSYAGEKILNFLSTDTYRFHENKDVAEAKFQLDIPHIVSTSEKVNVESIVAASATALDLLESDESDPQKMLDLIAKLETYHSPMLDILGLLANEMLVSSATKKARLRAGGKQEYIERAEEYLEKIRSVGFDRIFEKVFGYYPDNKSYGLSSETPYGENIDFSRIEFDGILKPYDGELISRLKSVGSTADKKANNPVYKDKMPNDIFGSVAVMPEQSDLPKVFEKIIMRLEEDPQVRFVAAASKKSPFYLQGSQEYVESFLYGLSGGAYSSILKNLEIKLINKPRRQTFQVAKFTAEVEIDQVAVPVEVQFQTVQDREIARLGDASHLYYKSGIVPASEADLRAVNRRRHAAMDRGNAEIVVRKSAERWRELGKLIMRGMGY